MGGERVRREGLTPVQVGLLRELVIRVAIGVDGVIQLLIRKERQDEIVVRLEQASKPLLMRHMMDLHAVSKPLPNTDAGSRTYVAKHFAPQLLTSLEPLHRRPILRDPLPLPIDTLQRVHQIRSRDARLRNRRLHRLLLRLEVERPSPPPLLVLLLAVPLLVLVLVLVLVLEGPEEGARGRRALVVRLGVGLDGPDALLLVGGLGGARGLAAAGGPVFVVFFVVEGVVGFADDL